jgi:hypothetical protein
MKYHSRKAIVDGIKFDSLKEAKRYNELKILEKANEITELRLQVKFELQPSFKKEGKTYRKIEYIADFTYYDNKLNKYIVEDTKGYKTEVYKLKKKLFEYKYPHLTIKEL